MAVVGAAAPAEHVERRQARAQAHVAVGQIERVADVQFGRGVEFGMVSARLGGKGASPSAVSGR